jgi:hypothetical protein
MVTRVTTTSNGVRLPRQWLLVMGRVMAANTEAAILSDGGFQMLGLSSFEVTQATS